jgi:ligand-binding sensor protein
MSFSLQPAIHAIEPTCLLDVLSEQLMRGLMQGFFLRERTGIALLHDDGDESRSFKRLDPFPSGDRRLLDHFSKFCSVYRRDGEHDARCQEYDQQRAREAYGSSTQEVLTYSCHMGLEDMCRPLFLGGRVRGVLFAGQIILDCESALQRVNQAIDRQIVEGARAELRQHAADSAIAFAAADARRASFKYLANAIQQALDALYLAKCEVATQAVLGELEQSLAGAIGAQGPNAWLGVVTGVVEELGIALGGAPVALLTRGKSGYRVRASIPTLPDDAQPTVPVSDVIAYPQNALHAVGPNERLFAILRALGGVGERAQVYRLDLAGGPELGISTLVLLGKSPRRSLQSLIVRCCHTLADRMNTRRLVLAALKQATKPA